MGGIVAVILVTFQFSPNLGEKKIIECGFFKKKNGTLGECILLLRYES